MIVATWEPNQNAVLEVIRDLGLELQVIFNKGAVMVLPSGVNKASGLAAALRTIGVSARNTVGVGDAENDHAFLRVCEVSAAVANALPSVKVECDIVLAGERGDGVCELADAIIERDLADLPPRPREAIELGTARDGAMLTVRPTSRILVAGRSGSGKSTVAVALLERLQEKGYQFCLVDPEGDHDNVLDVVPCIGTAARPPSVDEVLGLASQPDASVSVNLLGVPIGERPTFFADLLPHLCGLRSRSGAPHWIVVDEAHHMLAADRPWAQTPIATAPGTVLITVHPAHVSRDVLGGIDAVIGVGAGARAVIEEYCKAAELPPPSCDVQSDGESLLFEPTIGRARAFQLTPSRAQHLRHRRKYAEGALGEDKSFYFRGPTGALNLRAQNLFLFLQIGDGVDDATWDYHLRNGDYESWLHEAIKDPDLAEAVAQVASDRRLDPKATRLRVRELVEARYTAPA